MTSAAAKTNELRDLYRELILDHARSPRHFGRIDGATHTAQGINPLCGDKLKLYFCVDQERRISNASFEGSGCAISVASASLLTDTIVGMPVEEAEAVFKTVTGRLTHDDGSSGHDAQSEDRFPKLRALNGVREFPSRVKCATLAWHALHAALNKRSSPATTE